MRRLLTASALFALAVCVTGASGQPPAKLDPPPKAFSVRLDKNPDPTDAAIAAALANDPDVKMAKARIQLAEAELAKARLAVTQKVLVAQSVVHEAKAAVFVAEQGVENLLAYHKAEKIPPAEGEKRSEHRLGLAKLESAKAKLALAEAELKLLTGGSAGVAVADPAAAKAAKGLAWLRLHSERDAEREALLEYMQAVELAVLAQNAIKGPIPDRIRAALDKPVKLGAKGEKVTFAQALEIFKKDAGLDVPVRPLPSPLPVIVSEGEELPVGAWFQLYQDTAGQQNPGFAFYVREYGLLVANKQSAPPDAPTLTEFWKLKPPTKEPKVESVPKK